MDLGNFWIVDPKTELPSVSLSLVTYTTPFVLIMAILAGFGIVESSSSILVLYTSFLGLYFGRRLKTSDSLIEYEEEEYEGLD